MNQPTIQVGIMSATAIEFNLHGLFRCNQLSEETTGKQHLVYQNNHIFDIFSEQYFDELLFLPEQPHSSYIELQKVTIGINFHWERTETQNFRGALKIMIDKGQLIAVNIINIEEYLQSVISSEMSATASPEFLRTHAIISRSWLMAQINRKNEAPKAKPESCIHTDTEWIQWFDREEHALFDVCADDHCQRYQGITRIASPKVKEAVKATHGMVLSYDDKICDTRFYKCCGGVTEKFENTWEPIHYPYLTTITDNTTPQTADLSDEEQARSWILSVPEAFCNTNDEAVLGQVLNDYDLETTHFFRWKVSYAQQELAELIHTKSGIDFGGIIDLIPLQRGDSGRIITLRIEGTRRQMIVGKELLIRRLLSPSHLYSSAFIVEKKISENNTTPEYFTLYGAGWGHGVGLCQIGAAVMCAQGYTHRQVLEHYYPGSIVNQHILYKI